VKTLRNGQIRKPKTKWGKKGTCISTICGTAKSRGLITMMSHAENYRIYIHILNKSLRSWLSAETDWFNFTTFHLNAYPQSFLFQPRNKVRAGKITICVFRFATLAEIPFFKETTVEIYHHKRSLTLKPVTHEQVFFDKCHWQCSYAHVYERQIFFDKFFLDKFYFLVWTN